MDSENQLIERVARSIPCQAGGIHGLSLGIGDDSAILSPVGKNDLILSCDAFLEGVHFLAETHPSDSVGYKALVRATSDLAAMGAIPNLFLLTLALPRYRTGAWLDGFLKGMGRAARTLGMRIAGGDTTVSPIISISITVIGEAPRGRAVKRSGAQAGDIVCVSGPLGRAQLGLELIKSGVHRGGTARKLLQPHLYPRIRIELGSWLAHTRTASAMIDISDGLSTDLRHLCASSRVGALLWANRIPCVKIPRRFTHKIGKLHLEPLQMALHGGEDYELLFSVPPKKATWLQQAPGSVDITVIGEIVSDKQIVLVDCEGRPNRLEPRGWDPFRNKGPARSA
jgi:thiamine-monophosphate kinase